ncbi:MAG TPA: site-specific integrase [Magnetospirillum sp.]|nr:site-specific integrase [Magnetospirillum sp.]
MTQTFENKTQAAKWAKAVEVAVENGSWPVRELLPHHLVETYFPPVPEPEENAPHDGWTLERALEHYLKTVSEKKKGYRQDRNLVAWWQRQPIAKKLLTEVTADDLQAHIVRRLAEGRSNSTIRNEVFLISGLYKVASERTSLDGWGLISLENPVAHVRLPKPPAPRKRRLEDAEDDDGKSEEERMLAALRAGTDGEQMVLVYVLALDTGMRLSELLDVRVGQVKRTRGGRYIERPDSKNGHPRKVVLTRRAGTTLDTLLAKLPEDADKDRRLFTLDANQVDYRWRKARKAAGVKGLHFHDLRHEGLSRMAEKGLTIGELAEQSGHRTAQVLLRYVNAKVSEVAKKLD